MTRGIQQAIRELRQSPEAPVLAEVDGLVIELRYKGRRTADDIFDEVGPWEGETADELRNLVHSARVDSAEPPARIRSRDSSMSSGRRGGPPGIRGR